MRTLPIVLLAVACHSPQSEKPRYGAVMMEVGRRFELAGRASAAGKMELAAFETGEIGELFERDLPRADLPGEGNTQVLGPLADAFRKTNVPALENAKDANAFASAFEGAAKACNECHQASNHGFIKIPTAPGKSVPDLE